MMVTLLGKLPGTSNSYERLFFSLLIFMRQAFAVVGFVNVITHERASHPQRTSFLTAGQMPRRFYVKRFFLIIITIIIKKYCSCKYIFRLVPLWISLYNNCWHYWFIIIITMFVLCFYVLWIRFYVYYLYQLWRYKDKFIRKLIMKIQFKSKEYTQHFCENKFIFFGEKKESSGM